MSTDDDDVVSIIPDVDELGFKEKVKSFKSEGKDPSEPKSPPFYTIVLLVITRP